MGGRTRRSFCPALWRGLGP